MNTNDKNHFDFVLKCDLNGVRGVHGAGVGGIDFPIHVPGQFFFIFFFLCCENKTYLFHAIYRSDKLFEWIIFFMTIFFHQKIINMCLAQFNIFISCGNFKGSSLQLTHQQRQWDWMLKLHLHSLLLFIHKI